MEGRGAIQKVLDGTDDRLVVIVGPCSIHDVKAGKEYAHKLRKQMLEFQSELVVVMRVYFEKPRTTVGWKGLINDPDLDGSFKINKGLRLAREFLLEVTSLGLPTAVEFLDTISPQYLADLVSWGAIGARTTESQVHRELASGLSMPVGFKNATSGDVKIAADAVMSARNPHSFLSVTKQGLAGIVHTRGNPYGHIILRGGNSGTNYDAASIESAKGVCAKGKIDNWIVVDCSHGNSQKKHTNQPIVAVELCRQISAGESAIVGVMLESNIKEGNQKLDPGKTFINSLQYGVSVTDACIDLDTTHKVLSDLAAAIRARRASADKK
jgi:3-deoxy-7-phosphoheptulonate synthase